MKASCTSTLATAAARMNRPALRHGLEIPGHEATFQRAIRRGRQGQQTLVADTEIHQTLIAHEGDLFLGDQPPKDGGCLRRGWERIQIPVSPVQVPSLTCSHCLQPLQTPHS